jgi:hypothetical protein
VDDTNGKQRTPTPRRLADGRAARRRSRQGSWDPDPDPEPPEDLPEGAVPLEPGDIRTVGEIDLGGIPATSVEFSPNYHLKAAGVGDDAIEAFAAEFGVGNVDLLKATLARAAKTMDEEARPSEGAMLWRGQWLDWPRQAMADFVLADELSLLLHELLGEADWPVGMNPPAEELRGALERYGSWLAEFSGVPLAREAENPGKPQQHVLVIHLAVAWPHLTGRRPTSYPAGRDKKPSRFYRACRSACGLLGLHPPSPSAVKNWLDGMRKGRGAPAPGTESPPEAR